MTLTLPFFFILIASVFALGRATDAQAGTYVSYSHEFHVSSWVDPLSQSYLPSVDAPPSGASFLWADLPLVVLIPMPRLVGDADALSHSFLGNRPVDRWFRSGLSPPV